MVARRWLIVAVAFAALASAAAACGSLASVSVAPVDASAPPEAATVPGGRCAEVDASPPQAPASLTNQTCNGKSGIDLGTDAQNCGWCGHSCGSGHACTSGLCAVSKLELPGGVPFALSGSTLYVANQLTVYSVSVSTNEVQRLVDVFPPDNSGIYGASVADQIYISTRIHLDMAPLDGGTPQMLDPFAGYSTIVARPPHIFEGQVDRGHFIDRFMDGGTRMEADIGVGYDVVVTPNGASVFFTGGMTVGDDEAGYRHALYRYDVAQQVVSPPLVELGISPYYEGFGYHHVAVDDDFVFFVDSGSGDLLRLPTDAAPGTTPQLLSAGNGRPVSTMAVDADRVYWFRGLPMHQQQPVMDLVAMSKCGGPELQYISWREGFQAPSGLIVGDSQIFFGGLVSVAK